MRQCTLNSYKFEKHTALTHTNIHNPHRFSCEAREYKYFIVQDGTLNIGAMRAAAANLLGEHDFRNFCKADVEQVCFKCVLCGVALF